MVCSRVTFTFNFTDKMIRFHNVIKDVAEMVLIIRVEINKLKENSNFNVTQ